MAETTTQPNNQTVAFRGRAEREMPSKSQAQNRFMHAAAEGSVKGVPKSVGEDFVAADAGRKIKRLPKHAKKLAKRGLVSDKQMQRMREG